MWLSPAMAQEVMHVRGARVELGEVVPLAPESLLTIDLGAAPTPGQRRLFTKEQLRRHIKSAGFDPDGLQLPTRVIAHVPGHTIAPAQLAERARPHIERNLPDGVKLKQLISSHAVVFSEDTRIGAVHMAKLPKRVGAVKMAVTVELTIGNLPYRRVPFTGVFEVSAAAARYQVKRGDEVQLLITRGGASIGAQSRALASMDVGDVGAFRIASTGKVLQARLVSRHRGEVILSP